MNLFLEALTIGDGWIAAPRIVGEMVWMLGQDALGEESDLFRRSFHFCVVFACL